MNLYKFLPYMAVMALAVAPASAIAGWKAMPGGVAVVIAKSGLTVTPKSDWNRWSKRPSPKGEIWTMDGVALNELAFFGGIATGESLFKERNKKDQPLPKFNSNMLAPDIAQMFESSLRIILQTSLFQIDSIAPVAFAGHEGVRFAYHYTAQTDEVRRKGEARAAVVKGKLYLINFAAPEIHYYDAGIDEARAIMEGVQL